MSTKYVIDESTLTDIADSLRELHGTTDPIPVDEFAGLITGVEPPVEEYMRIIDYAHYPTPVNEKDYSKEDVALCTELYNFYLEMEDAE
jgi:hypothetical protein